MARAVRGGRLEERSLAGGVAKRHELQGGESGRRGASAARRDARAGILYATAELLGGHGRQGRRADAQRGQPAGHRRASYAMPDAHWGYGFPVGGVAAFDPDEGVVSAGGWASTSAAACGCC